ncbi:hypothetical protein Q3G72_015172 [Acer saccharum]|nr:hypothetical protein Q3G72_015172 [Acer saccharum]
MHRDNSNFFYTIDIDEEGMICPLLYLSDYGVVESGEMVDANNEPVLKDSETQQVCHEDVSFHGGLKSSFLSVYGQQYGMHQGFEEKCESLDFWFVLFGFFGGVEIEKRGGNEMGRSI